MSNVIIDNALVETCVRSVKVRGFWLVVPEATKQPLLMAQFLRLAEEVGEFVQADILYRATPPAAEVNGHAAKKLLEEAADVLIVWSQVAALIGMHNDEICISAVSGSWNPSIVLGEIGRALRKSKEHYIAAFLPMRQLVRLVYQTVRPLLAEPADLHGCVLAKLEADERRGYLHGE